MVYSKQEFRKTHIESIHRCNNSLSSTLTLFSHKHVHQLQARNTELS